MKKLTILFLLICSSAITGQTISPENRIVVIGKAEIEIPADKAVFRIKISQQNKEDIKKAYALHKEAERKLVSFLSELKIPNKNINYTLINMGNNEDYNPKTELKEKVYFTHQTVIVTLDSIKNYSEFMLKLVSVGFNHINTNFISSKEHNFHDKLIEKAIEMATKKAWVMAKTSKRNLGKIIKVLDTEENDPNFSYRAGWVSDDGFDLLYDSNENRGNSGITSIPQTIKKSISVKVVFELK